jgi:hypothetical protein
MGSLKKMKIIKKKKKKKKGRKKRKKKFKKKIIKRGQSCPYYFWPFVSPLLVFSLCGIVSNPCPF